MTVGPKLACLFVAGAAACLGQADERAVAMRWADYYAASYRVPRELVHSIIEVESGWQSRAVSSKGAAGLMSSCPQPPLRSALRTASRLHRTSGVEWRICPTS